MGNHIKIQMLSNSDPCVFYKRIKVNNSKRMLFMSLPGTELT